MSCHTARNLLPGLTAPVQCITMVDGAQEEAVVSCVRHIVRLGTFRVRHGHHSCP